MSSCEIRLLFGKVCMRAHFCRILWDPMDYSLPGSSVHRFSQARILKWVAISFSRLSSFPTQRLNPHLLHWQADSLLLSHLGSAPIWQSPGLNKPSAETLPGFHCSFLQLFSKAFPLGSSFPPVSWVAPGGRLYQQWTMQPSTSRANYKPKMRLVCYGHEGGQEAGERAEFLATATEIAQPIKMPDAQRQQYNLEH